MTTTSRITNIKISLVYLTSIFNLKVENIFKMPIKYIGRTLDFKGKTLWEIVGNLKNFGVGRIVVRNIVQERYPEPSYMKIVKVESAPTPEFTTPDDVRKVHVWVEKVFRGYKHPELIKIFGASYKPDYILIPKDKEAQYCKIDKTNFTDRIVPRTTSFPPLLRELITREKKAKGEDITKEPQMTIVYRRSRESLYRIAEEGEESNIKFTYGMEGAVSPNLYQNVKQ